jgi:hypothetical protein
MLVAMPAKAGIQVLKEIARFARDLKTYLRVAPPLAFQSQKPPKGGF